MNLLVGLLNGLAAFLPAATRYGAVSSTCGAAAGFLAPAVHQPTEMAFALGFLLPVGPMVLFFSSARRLRTELKLWDDWQKAGVITQDEERKLRRTTLYALTIRWYGAAALDQDAFAPERRPRTGEAGK